MYMVKLFKELAKRLGMLGVWVVELVLLVGVKFLSVASLLVGGPVTIIVLWHTWQSIMRDSFAVSNLQEVAVAAALIAVYSLLESFEKCSLYEHCLKLKYGVFAPLDVRADRCIIYDLLDGH